MDIGHRIYEIRKKNNMSQEQFAEQFHVTRQTVSNWENNRNYPDMNVLKEISDRFDVSFDYLLKEDRELIEKIDSTRKEAGIGKKIILVLSLIIIMALCVFLVPKIVSIAYYNPMEVVSSSGNGEEVQDTMRLETDLKVYEELYVPGCRLDTVNVQKVGVAKYNVSLSPSVYYDMQKPDTVTGQFDKGNVFWYNPEGLERPSSNIFEWTCGDSKNIHKSLAKLYDQAVDELKKDHDYEEDFWEPGMGAGGTHEDSVNQIEELKSDVKYQAYLSFDEVMDYSSAIDFIEKEELSVPWLAIVTDEEFNDAVGMYAAFSGNILNWDQKKYPDLIWYLDENGDYAADMMKDEELANRRFQSLLTYMKDQEKFRHAMEKDDARDAFYYDDKIAYIKKHGIKVYGISFDADKKELKKLIQDPKVYSIAVE